MEIVELDNAITEMKNSVQGLNSRDKRAEELLSVKTNQ